VDEDRQRDCEGDDEDAANDEREDQYANLAIGLG
jgi:hypothetical protein